MKVWVRGALVEPEDLPDSELFDDRCQLSPVPTTDEHAAPEAVGHPSVTLAPWEILDNVDPADAIRDVEEYGRTVLS